MPFNKWIAFAGSFEKTFEIHEQRARHLLDINTRPTRCLKSCLRLICRYIGFSRKSLDFHAIGAPMAETEPTVEFSS